MPARPLEPYNIPGNRTPVVDARTGLFNNNWYNFLYYISQSIDILVDAGVIEAALAKLQAENVNVAKSLSDESTSVAATLAQQRQADSQLAVNSLQETMMQVQNNMAGILQRLNALESQVSVDMTRF